MSLFKINIGTFGNRVVDFTVGIVPLRMQFQWNGRMEKYFVQITNRVDGVVVPSQSLEPYEVLNMQSISLNGGFIIPVISNPTVLDTGEIVYDFESLDTSLILLYGSEQADLLELSNYGDISSL